MTTTMRAMVECKRGNVAERSKSGHCLCVDCLKFRAAYRKVNPRTEYQAKWRAANKEKSCAYSKKWADANKDRRRQIENSWKSANPEKVKEYNKKAGRKWAKNNKGKRNAIDMKRKASLINRTPAWADAEKIKSFYIEASKMSKYTGVPHEVDHIIPLQGRIVSGLHVPNNLQVITRSENRSKQNSYTEEL